MAAPDNITPTVLMLNLPPSALGGINLLSFTTTPRFHGIKNLPGGWHFVFVSSTSSLSMRHGAWFQVKNTTIGPPEIFIKKWDSEHETFVAETSDMEVLRWRANLGSIWREGLTPYRQTVPSSDSTTGSGDKAVASSSQSNEADFVEEDTTDWVNLTSHITVPLLTRITGDTTPDHWSLTSASSAARDMDNIPGLSTEQSEFQPEKELRFLPIDLKQTWREGATGRERTLAARDRSWALGDIIEHQCGGKEMEVLGELQFCFLMVLTLNNHSCLEQWKRILEVLLTCRRAVDERPKLFVELLSTLRLQLQHCGDVEGGLFDLSDEGGNLLKSLLRKFRKGLDEIAGTEKQDVMDELDDLEAFLKSGYGWELDDSFVRRGMLELEDGEQVEMEVAGYEEEDETGEYAPMVVELTPAQIRALSGVDVPDDQGDKEKELVEEKVNGEMDEDEAELDDMDARF